ncbi:drug resistance transporter, Bcr/CflA subfamily domain protein [Ochrobactrum quorumnocens]|uniref:Drug resistance transporter, Bcr/CflA subfamily domain protein n=1 Tax=Ochrobactrum quorumnocens TaxID=271865 RepID=A0A248UEE7_9HYPH|nr:drug resistance transporter, Bcr/CflA subfamily domain protein [[Ochrobactrum] quorumnocens]
MIAAIRAINSVRPRMDAFWSGEPFLMSSGMTGIPWHNYVPLAEQAA